MTTNQQSPLMSLKAQLAAVPQEPGVYLWKNAEGAVLYVGKAKRLRARMRQYVNLQDERATVPALMAAARSFDYLVTASEHESLILEKNLINQYSPPFNVDFKDDKSYPFIALTLADTFPAIKYTREKPQPGTRYFGPYTNAWAAHETIDTARRIVPLCKTSCVEWKRLRRAQQAAKDGASAGDSGADEGEAPATLTAPAAPTANTKPCFDHHVGLGPGPCTGACTPERYAEHVKRITRFLTGHRSEFIATLTQEIQQAAQELDFERAGRVKKRLDALQGLKDKQNVILSPRTNADVIGFHREETITGVQVLSVREGVVLLANEFILDKGLDVGDDELVSTFLLRYYEQATEVPREVLLEQLPADAPLIADWLTKKRASPHGAKVHLKAPQAGEKYQLLVMTQRNARHALNRYMVRTRYTEERVNSALLELESALALSAAPLRIECYDISTFHGAYSVASMVVFEGGLPAKKHYRHFKVRLVSEEANDVAMMAEVIERRFSVKNRRDTRFAAPPDLIIVDGGKPQLGATRRILSKLNIEQVAVVGLAKRDEELFVAWQDEPVMLPSGSASLYLVKQVRDEAHRFAISYHRKLRGKGMTASVLDGIPGLGVKRQKILYKAFGSQKALKAASEEELGAIKGIPKEVAQAVYAALH